MSKPIEYDADQKRIKREGSPKNIEVGKSTSTVSSTETVQNGKPAVVTADTSKKHLDKNIDKAPSGKVLARNHAAVQSAVKSGAANGDDDAMSLPQPTKTVTFASTTEDIKTLWKQQITTAKNAWTKLTEDELQAIEGHTHKLIDLIQARYVLTREEANKQVKNFFDKFMPSRTDVAETKSTWTQQLGAAKKNWAKLTEDELMKTEGQNSRLARLVQDRYAIQRDEAERQVNSFFEANVR